MPVLVSLLATLLVAPAGAPQAPDEDAPDVTVTGAVLDAAGKPVVGAAITWMTPVSGSFDSFDVPFPNGKLVTDARGRFALSVPPGPLAVVVERRGARTTTLRSVPVLAAEGAKVVLRLDGTASIRGRAVDQEGQPLGGMQITVIPERTRADAARGDTIIARGLTADDGTFQLSGLRPGAHRLLAKARGWRCVEACEYTEGMKVEPGPVAVSVPMKRIGSISGRVVQRDANGEPTPVPVFRVESKAIGSRLVVAEDGRFDIDVRRLWAPVPVFVSAPDLASFATTFELPEAVAVDLGEIVLGPGRTVRGRVLDAAGRPIEGATASIGFVKGALREPVARTDARGVFELADAPASPTPLVVTHPSFRSREVVVHDGAGEVDVRLALAVQLPVRVADVDGSPVPGAQVWTVGVEPSRCRTGPDGRCVLGGLEQKEQILEFRHPGARPAPRQLRVPVTAAPSEIVLRIPRVPSMLRVTVVAADGTFAAASANVIPERDAPAPLTDPAREKEVPHYTGSAVDLVKPFENLPPGRYTVVARDGGRCAAKVVELGEGADVMVTVKLPAGPGPCRRE